MKCCFLHLRVQKTHIINVLKFSPSLENEHCYNSAFAGLVYFLVILRKFVLANENPGVVNSKLSRKWGNQKQQNILYGKHQGHLVAVSFFSVTEETSFVKSSQFHCFIPNQGNYLRQQMLHQSLILPANYLTFEHLC